MKFFVRLGLPIVAFLFGLKLTDIFFRAMKIPLPSEPAGILAGLVSACWAEAAVLFWFSKQNKGGGIR